MGDGADAARETEEMASFSLELAGLSPFYDPSENPQLQKGVIRHAALEPVDPHDLTKGFQLVEDKPEPKLFEKTTAADNYEEIYQRLDRALALHDDDPKSAIADLYVLRDDIYRGLR
jgi:hypothetical protein